MKVMGGILVVAALAFIALDAKGDFERGDNVKGGAKLVTSVLSLGAKTPYGMAVATAWGALEHSKDPEIRQEGTAAGDFVSNLVPGSDSLTSRVAGGTVAAWATTNLSVAAAIGDMAESGFLSSPVGMVGSYFDLW